MDKVFALIFALSQTIVVLSFSYRWIKEITWQVLIICTLCYLLWGKNKWLSLFILWSTFIFFLNKGMVINDAGDYSKYNVNAFALFNLINIVLIGVFYLTMGLLRLDKHLMYKTLCFIGIFQSCYAILQFCGIDQFFLHLNRDPKHIETWAVGTWANEALCSWCIALCSPFFLAFKELRFKIGYGICFVAILCLKCSAGIVGFALGFLFWLWHTHKRTFYVTILVTFLLGLAFVLSGKASYYLNDSHRTKVWTKAIDIWKVKPITGHGLGSFKRMFYTAAPEFQRDGRWAQAHNEYIQVLFEEGIIGLGLVFGMMFTLALSFYRTRKGLIPFTCLVIGAFISIFSFPFHTAMGGIIIVALVLYEKERGATKSWLETFIEDYKDEVEEI